MQIYELRALMLATVLSTHNIKRPINETEMKEALAMVDQMIAATCPSCDGTGKFDTGMEPATRSQRPEDEKKFGPGASQVLTKESDPVLITKMAQEASADLAASLEKSLEVKCKACGDTGKSSKGKPCICEAGQKHVQSLRATNSELAPVAPPEPPKELRAVYATEEYVCEQCNNANLEVELVIDKTPQLAKYTCKDCSHTGEIDLPTDDDYTDFITSAKKIKQEVKPPEAKKPRAKKADAAPVPTPAPVNDMPVVEAAPKFNPLEQFKAPVVLPIPPKLPAPIAAAAQVAEQHVTGSAEVQISEVAPVDTNAARESLKGMFDSMEDEKVIKEWESMTSKVFDSKVMQLSALRAELLERLLGLY